MFLLASGIFLTTTYLWYSHEQKNQLLGHMGMSQLMRNHLPKLAMLRWAYTYTFLVWMLISFNFLAVLALYVVYLIFKNVTLIKNYKHTVYKLARFAQGASNKEQVDWREFVVQAEEIVQSNAREYSLHAVQKR